LRISNEGQEVCYLLGQKFVPYGTCFLYYTRTFTHVDISSEGISYFASYYVLKLLQENTMNNKKDYSYFQRGRSSCRWH
jgi:hypothetical protein